MAHTLLFIFSECVLIHTTTLRVIRFDFGIVLSEGILHLWIVTRWLLFLDLM